MASSWELLKVRVAKRMMVRWKKMALEVKMEKMIMASLMTWTTCKVKKKSLAMI